MPFPASSFSSGHRKVMALPPYTHTQQEDPALPLVKRPALSSLSRCAEFWEVMWDITVKYRNEEIDLYLQTIILSRGERFVCEFNIGERSWT